MELVKNKMSGKYFVVLDDTGSVDFLVVTPEGKVRRLERRLFGVQEIADPVEAMASHNLTGPQLDIYSRYNGE